MAAAVAVSVCAPLRLPGGREREEEKVRSVMTSEFLVLYVLLWSGLFCPYFQDMYGLDSPA
jgi:hypothetical protein